jgi:hypothetical protein
MLELSRSQNFLAEEVSRLPIICMEQLDYHRSIQALIFTKKGRSEGATAQHRTQNIAI